MRQLGKDKPEAALYCIPVRANWNFVDAKNFTMYVSAGGAIEKCVYGKIGTESETVKPVQLSVMGAVGAQYNIAIGWACMWNREYLISLMTVRRYRLYARRTRVTLRCRPVYVLLIDSRTDMFLFHFLVDSEFS